MFKLIFLSIFIWKEVIIQLSNETQFLRTCKITCSNNLTLGFFRWYWFIFMTKIAAYYFVINNFAIKSISIINIDARKADNLEINIFSTDDNSILTGTKRNKQSDFITRTNFKINCITYQRNPWGRLSHGRIRNYRHRLNKSHHDSQVY